MYEKGAWLRLSCIVLVALMGFGCATTAGDVKKKSDVAILTSVGSGLGAAINPLGVKHSVAFKSLDGAALSKSYGAFNPGEIEVPPGKHNVVALCFWKKGGLDIKGEHEVVKSFEAGKVYYFKSVLRAGGTCEIEMQTE